MGRLHNKYMLAFILGSLIVILIFTVIPLFYSVFLSLHSGRANNLVFAGLENYRRMIDDPMLINALRNTVGFSLVLTPVVLTISFLLANCINNVRSERLKGIYSVILFFPSITSPIAYAFFFRQFFLIDGFLNNFISIFNPSATFTNYLLTPLGARIAIVVVCIWAWSGYYTMLMLSAMQSIDPIVRRAAKVDGLSRSRILYKIVLPIILPVVLLCSILLFGGIFQLFAEVMVITRGGPAGSTMTLSLYMYQLSFQFVPQFGYAASIAVLIFLISSIVGFVQFKLGDRYE